MKYSKYFLHTKKNVSASADSKNARYFERANMVAKHISGVYAFLPSGLLVLRKIENIIRDEMNKVDGQEILMNVLQPRGLWDETGRFDKMKDIFYKTFSRKGEEMGLAPTHEEQVVDIVRRNINSYKDLPLSLFQIQTKFRNEPRAKSGLLRGREFIMKDMYSFHLDSDDFAEYYERVKNIYFDLYNRCGLKALAVEASGGVFSKYSHEFQVINEIGEDKIYICSKCGLARNKEIVEESNWETCSSCGGKIEIRNGIEVGNIFPLGGKFCRDMNLKVKNQKGEDIFPVMGCYGIGLGRLMATVVEEYFVEEKNKMIWPKELNPWDFYLISLGENEKAENLYEDLKKNGINVFYDDREVGAGEKFADADLLGCGYKIIISKKSLENGGVELVDEYLGERKIVTLAEIVNRDFL